MLSTLPSERQEARSRSGSQPPAGVLLSRLAVLLACCAVAAFAGQRPTAGPAPAQTGQAAVLVDKVEVFKSRHELVLLKEGKVVRAYRVALSVQPGKKEREGDYKTPEGSYVLDWRNPKSAAHRFIHISYPSAEDVANARRQGRSLRLGGDIFLHGLPNGQGWIGAAHTATDWTYGCIAVTDEEIEQIWALVRDGTPIVIHP